MHMSPRDSRRTPQARVGCKMGTSESQRDQERASATLDNSKENKRQASGNGRKDLSKTMVTTSTQLLPAGALATSSFGSHMPSACPPTEAGPAQLPLYRLVPAGELTDDGFKTTAEEEGCQDGDPCQRHSISTYSDIRRVEKMKERATHWADHSVAVGTPPFEAGVVMRTGGSRSRNHYSWWPRIGIVRHSFFRKIP
jgi:hypothetical protein